MSLLRSSIRIHEPEPDSDADHQKPEFPLLLNPPEEEERPPGKPVQPLELVAPVLGEDQWS
jgi:hypothetical protein